MEWKTEIEGVLRLQHRFDEHPLVLVDKDHEQGHHSEKAYCSGCGEMLKGACFSCADCQYQLHQNCAEAPFEIHKHPLHREHQRFFLRDRPRPDTWYACALCKEKRDMFFYECYDCYFCLDIDCALFLNKVGQNIYHSVDDAHQHPFKFIKSLKDELINVSCSWCHQPLIDSVYVSVDYKFYFHQTCFELPTQMDHPLHRMHTLFLKYADDKNQFCKLCKKEDNKEHNNYLFYHCSACNFYIHLECIKLPRPIIQDRRHHEHPFVLLWTRDSFTCDACGTNGKFVSYICSTCQLHVHEKCASLPHAIKITRHDHPLFHWFFFGKNEFEKRDCQVCLEELKTEYGNYHCLKEDCNYVVHVGCAIGDSSLYEIFDEKSPKNFAEDMESSISVIEANEDGETMKTRHFLHDKHDLLLEDKIIKEEDRDIRCNGCVLSVTTPFYHCLECDFVLHKACAELPRKKHHWYDRFPATLHLVKIHKCQFCGRWCSGFFYIMENSHHVFCLRCFKVPDILKHEGHKHKLFFDHKWQEQCNVCGGRSRKGTFRCRYCTFTLDFACVTLPLEVQHKCDDEHLLKLSYQEENDGDTEQQCCDICETKRDPNQWDYRCATCDNSAHRICVLGNYPFLHIGTTLNRLWEHSHPLRFTRRIYEYPAECHVCGKHCEDLFLDCATCNYIRHLDCSLLEGLIGSSTTIPKILLG